jgi:hypothetical protein
MSACTLKNVGCLITKYFGNTFGVQTFGNSGNVNKIWYVNGQGEFLTVLPHVVTHDMMIAGYPHHSHAFYSNTKYSFIKPFNSVFVLFSLALKSVQLIFKAVAHFTNIVFTSNWYMHSLATYSDVSASTNVTFTFCHFLFKFFSWPCELLVYT